MLKKCGEFWFAWSNLSSVALEKNIGSPRSKHSKRRTQIQTNQKGEPNPTKGTTTKFNAFEALPYFQCFRI